MYVITHNTHTSAEKCSLFGCGSACGSVSNYRHVSLYSPNGRCCSCGQSHHSSIIDSLALNVTWMCKKHSKRKLHTTQQTGHSTYRKGQRCQINSIPPLHYETSLSLITSDLIYKAFDYSPNTLQQICYGILFEQYPLG